MSQQRKLIFIIVLVALLVGATGFEQSLPLTRTYISPSLVFTFQYPESWSVEELDIAVMLIPDNDTTILLTSEMLASAPVDDPLVSVLTGFTQILTDQPYEPTDVMRTRINEHPAAFLDLYAEDFQTSVTTIQLTPNTIAIMVVLGEAQDIRDISSTLQGVIKSIEIPEHVVGGPPEDVEILGSRYNEPNSWVSFAYEDDWQVQEIGDNVELVAPNGIAVSIARQILDAPDKYGENKPVNFIQSLIDPVQVRSGSIFMGNVFSFQVNGRPAASVDLIDNQTLVRLIVLDMTQNENHDPTLVTVTISGHVLDVGLLEAEISEIVQSLVLRSDVVEDETLTNIPAIVTYDSEETGLSFLHPSSWVVFDGVPIIVTNDESIIRWREPNDLQAGEIVVTIYPNLDELMSPDVIHEGISPSMVIETLSGGLSHGETVTLGDHVAAMSITSDGVMDRMLVAIPFPDGEIAVISASTAMGTMESFRDTIMTLAESMTQR